MDKQMSLLITLLHETRREGAVLIRCALSFDPAELDPQCVKYYNEPENRILIHALLPTHVQKIGPIVDIEDLFNITIIN